jgi:hypothetical protein
MPTLLFERAEEAQQACSCDRVVARTGKCLWRCTWYLHEVVTFMVPEVASNEAKLVIDTDE